MVNTLLITAAIALGPDQEAFERVVAKLATYQMFPARPVYWPDDKSVGVGVIPEESPDLNLATHAVCEVLKEEGLIGMTVEVYDVVKIQYEDEWVLLDYRDC